MLPADFPCLSLSRTSVRVVHVVPCGKKNEAASSAMIHRSRNRIGHVMAVSPSTKTLHTPRGLLALSFVQFGTRLLKGHRRCLRCLSASESMLSIGNPKTSASGCGSQTATTSGYLGL